MGIVTQEMLDAGRIRFQYISFDKDDGLVQNVKDSNGKITTNPIPGIQGYFLGINAHDFEYKDKPLKKLDIYLKDDEQSNVIWQIQFGFYTWATWFILNKLLTVREGIKSGDNFQIVAQKGEDDFFTWFLSRNGIQLKQKFTRSQDAKILKFKANGDPDNDKIKNKHIDTWFEKLCETMKYESNTIEESVRAEENIIESNKKGSEIDEFDDPPF